MEYPFKFIIPIKPKPDNPVLWFSPPNLVIKKMDRMDLVFWPWNGTWDIEVEGVCEEVIVMLNTWNKLDKDGSKSKGNLVVSKR